MGARREGEIPRDLARGARSLGIWPGRGEITGGGAVKSLGHRYRCIHSFHTNITPSIRIGDFGILNVCMKITFLSVTFTSISNSFYAAIIYTRYIVVLKKAFADI